MRKVERAAHCDCSIYYKIYSNISSADTKTQAPCLHTCVQRPSPPESKHVKAPDRHIRQALCSMWHGVRTTAVANPHKIRRCLCGELFVRIDLPDYSLRGFSLAVLQLGFGLVVIHFHSASNIPYSSILILCFFWSNRQFHNVTSSSLNKLKLHHLHRVLPLCGFTGVPMDS